jgi:hypothetical protein
MGFAATPQHAVLGLAVFSDPLIHTFVRAGCPARTSIDSAAKKTGAFAAPFFLEE